MIKIKNKRWRLLANLPIQGGLLLRVCAYWIVFQIGHTGTVAMFDFLSNGQASNSGGTGFVTPALVVSFLFLPIALLDMTMFSNRFVGPLVGLRRKMIGLAEGESVQEVRFRPGDFYQDLGDAFNVIRNNSVDENETEDAKVADRIECHV